MAIKPRTKVPALDLPLLGGGRFEVADRQPRSFTMIVAYRGLHCPICKTYIRDLDRKLDDFVQKGVDALAISTDTKERAEQSKSEWGIERLPIAYGLTIEKACEWGLFISASIKENEPALFAEPGLFLVKPDSTLYAASIHTMPFARPSFSDVPAAVDFVTQKNYPARGEA
jgi:peroxiredoxin